jgi:long-chain acyl-CoA synthetase
MMLQRSMLLAFGARTDLVSWQSLFRAGGTPKAEPSYPSVAWQIVSQATAAYSLTLVSLYDTLGPNVVEYCINHSDTRIAFAAPSHLPQLLSLAKACPKLKVLVSVDTWASLQANGARPGSSSEQALKAWGAEVGVQVLDIAEGEFRGSLSF